MISFVSDEDKTINVTDDFGITKQVALIKDFKIKGDFSISFSIQNNSETREALGYYHNNQVSKGIVQTKFNLIRNGNKLMRGSLVIESVSEKQINLFFISGNSNWFKLFDFSCKDISNNGFQVRWNNTSIQNSVNQTQGIIFPAVDWMFNRKKYDGSYWYSALFGIDGTWEEGFWSNSIPCLYVHTLVNELCKVAGIKLSGDILNDVEYLNTIITPDGPEITNETGRISHSGLNNLIRIENIAPEMKAIDFMKWLIFKFGCISTFDEYSKTLTLNIIDNIIKDDSYDWSEYVIDYEIDYNQSGTYLIQVDQDDADENLNEYNKVNDLSYGGLEITTDVENGEITELYTDPFKAVFDDVGDTSLQYAGPYIPFYELEDLEQIRYSSVTDNGGLAQFNGPINSGHEGSNTGLIFRVVDDYGIYDGYHVNHLNLNNNSLFSSSLYLGNSSGTIYLQNVNPRKAGHRILRVKPNVLVNQFTNVSYLSQDAMDEPTSGLQRVHYAWYSKPFYTMYSYLNGLKVGVNWGEINREKITTSNIPGGGTGPDIPVLSLFVTAELSVSEDVIVYYNLNGSGWQVLYYVTPSNYPTYVTLSPLDILDGYTVSIGVQLASDSSDVTFGLTTSASASYTGYCGQDTTTQFTMNGDVSKYINIKCTSGTPNTITTC